MSMLMAAAAFLFFTFFFCSASLVDQSTAKPAAETYYDIDSQGLNFTPPHLDDATFWSEVTCNITKGLAAKGAALKSLYGTEEPFGLTNGLQAKAFWEGAFSNLKNAVFTGSCEMVRNEAACKSSSDVYKSPCYWIPFPYAPSMDTAVLGFGACVSSRIVVPEDNLVNEFNLKYSSEQIMQAYYGGVANYGFSGAVDVHDLGFCSMFARYYAACPIFEHESNHKCRLCLVKQPYLPISWKREAQCFPGMVEVSACHLLQAPMVKCSSS